MTVLAFAAYIAFKSPTQPASGFKVAVSQPAGRAQMTARAPQSASEASTKPVTQETRLPAQAPSLVSAAHVGRRETALTSPHNSYAQLRPAIDYAPSGSVMSQPAAQGSVAIQGNQAPPS